MEELRAFKRTIIYFLIPTTLFLIISIFNIILLVQRGFVSYPSGNVNINWIYPIIAMLIAMGFLGLYSKRFRIKYNDTVEQIRLNVYGVYAWLIPIAGPIIYYRRMHKLTANIKVPNDKFATTIQEQGFREYAEAMANTSSDKDAKFWDDVIKDMDSLEQSEASLNNKEYNKKQSKKKSK